jgi:hypothetical protein
MALLIIGTMFRQVPPPTDEFVRKATTNPDDPDKPYVRQMGFQMRLKQRPAGLGYGGTMAIDGDLELADSFDYFKMTFADLRFQVYRNTPQKMTAYTYLLEPAGLNQWEGRWTSADDGEGMVRCIVLEDREDFLSTPPNEWVQSLGKSA